MFTRKLERMCFLALLTKCVPYHPMKIAALGPVGGSVSLRFAAFEQKLSHSASLHSSVIGRKNKCGGNEKINYEFKTTRYSKHKIDGKENGLRVYIYY